MVTAKPSFNHNQGNDGEVIWGTEHLEAIPCYFIDSDSCFIVVGLQRDSGTVMISTSEGQASPVQFIDPKNLFVFTVQFIERSSSGMPASSYQQ